MNDIIESKMNDVNEIRQWREAKGLSRKELAKLCHMTPAAIANWELNRNAPHNAALHRLQQVMQGEVSITPLTLQEERMLDEIVERGGYENREAFLTAKLVEVIKTLKA